MGEAPAPGGVREEVIIDAVPDQVREAARAAFARHESDVDVADISYDSLLDEPESTDPVRRLRFATADRSVELAVRPAGPALDVEITVVPAGATIARLRLYDGPSFDAEVDRTGRATVTGIPPGLVSVLVAATEPDGRPLRTAWVRL